MSILFSLHAFEDFGIQSDLHVRKLGFGIDAHNFPQLVIPTSLDGCASHHTKMASDDYYNMINTNTKSIASRQKQVTETPIEGNKFWPSQLQLQISTLSGDVAKWKESMSMIQGQHQKAPPPLPSPVRYLLVQTSTETVHQIAHTSRVIWFVHTGCNTMQQQQGAQKLNKETPHSYTTYTHTHTHTHNLTHHDNPPCITVHLEIKTTKYI